VGRGGGDLALVHVPHVEEDRGLGVDLAGGPVERLEGLVPVLGRELLAVVAPVELLVEPVGEDLRVTASMTPVDCISDRISDDQGHHITRHQAV
jgi:hypothetical protein